eukprot:gene11078-3784_t
MVITVTKTTTQTPTTTEYSKLTIPDLKILCKERSIKGITKLKKEEIIEKLMENEISKYQDMTIPQIKTLCKENNIKGYSTLNKENLIRKYLNLPLSTKNKKETVEVELKPTFGQNVKFSVSMKVEEKPKASKKRKEIEKDDQPRKKSKTEKTDKSIVQCDCQVPATKKTTKKDGPNQGREFYTCKTNHCKYFLWVE